MQQTTMFPVPKDVVPKRLSSPVIASGHKESIFVIKDAHFGPTLMFGLGGIFVEVLKDVTFRVAPITKKEARKMISEVKVYSLLRGYRNRPSLDIDALFDILLNASKLVVENQEIKELDLNPIFVYSNGAKTVDAKIILE